MSCYVFPEVQTTAKDHAKWIPGDSGTGLARQNADECYCDVALRVHLHVI